MKIKYLVLNDNGKVEFTKEEITELINEAYDEGYQSGYSAGMTVAPSPIYPIYPYYLTTTPTDKIEITCEKK